MSPTEKRSLTEERHRNPRLTAALERECGAGDDGHEVAEHRDERKDPVRRIAEVHVPVAPGRRPVRLAEEVAEDVGRRHAAREVARELAVERGDDVVGPEREPGAGGDRLLAATGVDGARDAPLPVERHHPVLEEALEQDEPEELDPLLAADCGVLGARARSAHQ